MLVEKYVEQKLPRNWQSFYTNNEGRVCLTQHSNFIGLLAGTVAGGIVLAVLRPVQTLATLLANKTQHCWAQHVASVCTGLYICGENFTERLPRLGELMGPIP